MKSHLSTLIPRMIRAGMRVQLRYKVIAAGIDNRNRIISLATNTPRLPRRGLHAEERVMFSPPKSLTRIIVLRVNRKGVILPIDVCDKCLRLATKRNIKVETYG